jgi:methylated-DNA-[protein]-cysteine S-methyltransferase
LSELRTYRTVDLEDASRSAAQALASRAAEEGLVDVAYATTSSPFGDLVVAVTHRGLVRLAYPNEEPGAVLEDLAARVSPRVLEVPGRLDALRRQLDEYFAGRRTRFETPVDLTLVRGFTREVLRATRRIPFGSVRTYRDVATRAGSPMAFRAAGNALGSNPIPIVVPCHRVIHAGGGLGGYTGGLERKVHLLQLEGVLEG